MKAHLCGPRAAAQAECDRANEPLDDSRILALAALDWNMAGGMVCTFTVPGEPVPKGRPVASVRRRGKKNVVTMRTPDKTLDYEGALRLIAQAHKPPTWPMRCKFRVTVDVYRTVERGDWDNYGKILDGLNPRREKTKGKGFAKRVVRPAVPGVLWADDSRVFRGEVEIHEVDSNPRLEVRVEAVAVPCERCQTPTLYPVEKRCHDCAATLAAKRAKRSA
jgi:Holliday junction resolvase RusA-like endonuclease